MSYPDRNGTSNQSGAEEAEKTLRLIARLPAPEGLEDRVHAGLHTAPRGGRILAWPVAQAGGWMRAAAAAAIVFVVAGGGWGVYSRVQPGLSPHAVAGPRLAAPGGFTEGGAVRRPQTLVGPAVKPPALPAAPAVAPRSKAPSKSTASPAARLAAAGKATPAPAAP